MPMTDAAACRFVAGYYGRRAGDVSGLGTGEWSRAYAFVLDGREAVIRFGDHVEDFRKDQVVAAHSCAALPIPAVIEIGAAGDGYFAVSERAHGELLDGLDGDGMRAALPGLLAALDALRAIRRSVCAAGQAAEDQVVIQPGPRPPRTGGAPALLTRPCQEPCVP